MVDRHDGFDGTPAATPAAPPPAPSHVDYFGGGILTHPDPVNVYIGDYFKTKAGQADVKHTDAAMKDMVHNKDFTSVWAQYGVGQGTTEASHQLGGTYKPGQTITDAQLRSMLDKAVANGDFNPRVSHTVKKGETLTSIATKLHNDGVVGKPVADIVKDLEQMNHLKNGAIQAGQKLTVFGARNPQAIYNMILPPGATLVTSDGTSSLQGLGGFHGNVNDSKNKPVYYSAIAYSKGNNGIDFDGKPQDNISITLSHEVSEAATDPNVDKAIAGNNFTDLGWYDPNNGEIGDMAVNDGQLPLNQTFNKLDGFAFQKIWSNVDNTNETKAVHPGPVQPLPKPTPPPPPAPAGGNDKNS